MQVALILMILMMGGSASGMTLHPNDYQVRKGYIDGDLTSVQQQDEGGLTLKPRWYGHDSTFRFTMPRDSEPEQLTLSANIKSGNGWDLYLKTNYGRWDKIADIDRQSSWHEINKSIERFDKYINHRNQLTVRAVYRGRDRTPLLIDYLALEIDQQSEPEQPQQPEQPPVVLPPVVDPAPSVGTWPPGMSWQVQYTGGINTGLNVQVYNLDLFDTAASTISNLKAQGKRVICYFSAGSYENWRPDAGSFPASVLGRNLDGWPGERWLDVSNLDDLMPIMSARMQLAADKGCDAVDPDNVDGYSNSTGFRLTYQHQLDYNKALVNAAKARGLSIGLKNNLDQVKDLVSLYDFAVNEECFTYDECDMLKPFIDQNKAVFGIEYELQASQFCPQANAMNMDFLKKNLDLDASRTACR